MKAVKKDLTGSRFGKLVALYDSGERRDERPVWICACDCGNEIGVTSKSLLRGNTQSCGCSRREDLTTQRFGKLVVVKLTDERKLKSPVWICRCDCGNEKKISSKGLKSRENTSCGNCPKESQNKFEINDEFCTGYTTKGQSFTFDLCDLGIVRNHTWFLHHGYPTTGFEGKQLTLHRLIFLKEKPKTIDHINGDVTDNRRCNLRFATQQQNCMNRAPRTKGTSKYKGVSWSSRTKQWQVQIMFKGKAHHLGYYQIEEDAARVYNEKAVELHGEFARVNTF